MDYKCDCIVLTVKQLHLFKNFKLRQTSLLTNTFFCYIFDHLYLTFLALKKIDSHWNVWSWKMWFWVKNFAVQLFTIATCWNYSSKISNRSSNKATFQMVSDKILWYFVFKNRFWRLKYRLFKQAGITLIAKLLLLYVVKWLAQKDKYI